MSDDAPRARSPAAGLLTRYFAQEGGGVQVVCNLRDPAPYRELGHREIDEQSYRASLPDSADVVCLEHLPD